MRSSLVTMLVAALALSGALQTTAYASDGARAAASTCGGLPDAEVSRPLFSEARDLHRLTEYVGKQRREVVRGVSFRVPARQGESAPYLERVIACQVAQAATGPLAVSDIRVSVRPSHASFEVRITTDSPAAARELAQRTEVAIRDAANGTAVASR